MSEQPHAAHGDDHGHGHGSLFIQHHYDDAQHQFDSGKLGIWLFLAQEVLFFSALFVAYILYRHHHPEIYAYAHKYLDVKLGAINTGVLIFSSLTAAWAVRAAQLRQQKLLIACLATTIACAFGFLVIKYFEYTHKIHEHILFGRYFDPCVSSGGTAAAHQEQRLPGHQVDGAVELRHQQRRGGLLRRPDDRRRSAPPAGPGRVQGPRADRPDRDQGRQARVRRAGPQGDHGPLLRSRVRAERGPPRAGARRAPAGAAVPVLEAERAARTSARAATSSPGPARARPVRRPPAARARSRPRRRAPTRATPRRPRSRARARRPCPRARPRVRPASSSSTATTRTVRGSGSRPSARGRHRRGPPRICSRIARRSSSSARRRSRRSSGRATTTRRRGCTRARRPSTRACSSRSTSR